MPLRDMDREQIWLLPPSLDELLPLDHPGRFVAEFVDGLDREGWAELGVEIEGDLRGAPAYHPRALQIDCSQALHPTGNRERNRPADYSQKTERKSIQD